MTSPPAFDDCLTAQLQFLGKTQAHGAVLVVDNNDIIVAASANSADWLGPQAKELLGHPWMAVFPELHPPSKLADLTEQGVTGIYLHAVTINDRALTMARHRTRDHVIVEFESRSEIELIGNDRGAILGACLTQLARTETEQQAGECLMHFLAMVTDYDRVMLLQFMPDWHGKVTAQVLKPGVQSYLNQHFPANDIPENARTLYRKKLQRLIADASSSAIDLLSTRNDPVDLTLSELRAVHPAHIQYMRNMGVASSFSVSILVSGKLWGLVVCHSLQARGISFADRQLCEHLASAAGLHMSGLKRLNRANERHNHLLARRQLKQDILANGLTTSVLKQQLAELCQTFNADGAWVCYRQEHYFDGAVPNPADRRALFDWLVSQQRGPVFSCNEISPALKDRPELARLAAGLLYIEVNDQDFLVLLRQEISESIEWAGLPEEKSADTGKAGLSPRTSFEAWSEQTRGHANPWHSADDEAAEELRKVLLELSDYMALEHQTLTDPLTGLGNRNLLKRTLDQWLDPNATKPETTAILMVDLDHFKPINDKYGHGVGDKVLVEVAQRMKALLRENDVLVRLGGDEFAVVMTRLRKPADVAALGKRLLSALTLPIALDDGLEVSLTASIGAAIYPTHATDAKTLLHQADMAMYQVKHQQRNGFQLYSLRAKN